MSVAKSFTIGNYDGAPSGCVIELTYREEKIYALTFNARNGEIHAATINSTYKPFSIVGNLPSNKTILNYGNAWEIEYLDVDFAVNEHYEKLGVILASSDSNLIWLSAPNGFSDDGAYLNLETMEINSQPTFNSPHVAVSKWRLWVPAPVKGLEPSKRAVYEKA